MLSVITAQLLQERLYPIVVVQVVEDVCECSYEVLALLIHRSRKEGAELGMLDEEVCVERSRENCRSIFGCQDGLETRTNQGDCSLIEHESASAAARRFQSRPSESIPFA